jgi:hypothetical protein
VSEPVTIKLSNPITVGSTTVTELTVQPCKAKYKRRLKTPTDRPFAMFLELAGYLTGQTTQVIDELEGADLAEVERVVTIFFANSQETGTEPSEY